MRHQIHIPVLRDENVVLQTNPQSFLPNINPRLASEHHTGFEASIFVTNVVNVEAQEVGSAMGKVLFIGRPFGVLFFNVFFGNEAQADELAFHNAADFLVVFIPDVAWDEEAFGGFENAKHRIVYIALALREAAVDGNAAREIGTVVRIFRSYVEQEDVAVFAYLVV
jgi:hypothetical protein